LRKINSKGYVVDLPLDFDISPSNVEDLVVYKGLNFPPDYPLLVSFLISPFLLHSLKYNPPIRQTKLMKLLMIRLSLLLMVITCF